MTNSSFERQMLISTLKVLVKELKKIIEMHKTVLYCL